MKFSPMWCQRWVGGLHRFILVGALWHSPAFLTLFYCPLMSQRLRRKRVKIMIIYNSVHIYIVDKGDTLLRVGGGVARGRRGTPNIKCDTTPQGARAQRSVYG